MIKYIAIFEVEDDCNIKTIDADVTYTYESNGTYYGMREGGIEFEKEKTGKWINDWEMGMSECSCCGETYLWEDHKGTENFHYCPNCGTRMVRE
jgi:hypothetical protein